ncbi:MAG: bifunctional 4-hydroxy-2-oxoglutarate aldolase/2-dehydro-3-deoxy-phosphogluconate aldolase [Vicinamibacterales bacterium]|nr:bifunctional 4-hydroxy-2-oxoglutarate aldolase/2-dehydro-3-deoxy-phosphogluconate aldolase [Vicinamibacterales bacterium]
MANTPLAHVASPQGQRARTVAEIEATGVVAIIRTKEPARVFDIVDALARGGVKTLEITMTVPGAVELIRSVARSLPEGILLGAGTVLDAATAHQVIDAGARFVVAPVFDPETVRACNERDVPVMPGCYTPTEMLQAWRAGADLIKVFPATTLGPGYLKDVAAPLPQLKLMPTGGVTPENVGTWIKAGAVAVGIGSALVDNKAVAAGDFAKIEASARLAITNIAAARAAR